LAAAASTAMPQTGSIAFPPSCEKPPRAWLWRGSWAVGMASLLSAPARPKLLKDMVQDALEEYAEPSIKTDDAVGNKPKLLN
jgi:hypothetical protein